MAVDFTKQCICRIGAISWTLQLVWTYAWGHCGRGCSELPCSEVRTKPPLAQLPSLPTATSDLWWCFWPIGKEIRAEGVACTSSFTRNSLSDQTSTSPTSLFLNFKEKQKRPTSRADFLPCCSFLFSQKTDQGLLSSQAPYIHKCCFTWPAVR